MLTHGDWHDFTLLILKCKEVMKIYGDHPYSLKPYIILSYHFILHNMTNIGKFILLLLKVTLTSFQSLSVVYQI